MNLRHQVVETFGDPDTATRRYRRQERRGRGERLGHTAFGAATVAVDDVLPGHG